MKAMGVSRRDFMRATSAIGAAFGLESAGVTGLVGNADAKETAAGGVPVLWLQGQSCSGCSVSLLNSIFYATIDDLAVNMLDINFHSNLTAATGNLAVSQIERTYRQGGYVLVLEGAIPTGSGGKFCNLWPGMTFQKAVERYTERAAFIMAAGTCASYGGIAAAAPNPTGCHGLADYYGTKRVVKIPGCPIHPDWVVGTIAYIMANGAPPALDSLGRPTVFYGKTLHEQCPYLAEFNTKYAGQMGHTRGQSCLDCHARTDTHVPQARALGVGGCLFALGCNGNQAHCDCSVRKWNGGAPGTPGVNWCVEAGAPCSGCTEPTFPDGMSPFFSLNGPGVDD
jgi:hydrogenase small subunit